MSCSRRLPNCKLPPAHLDWAPVSRATLVALDRWVATNATPPDNKLMPLEPTTDADVLASPKHLAKAVMQRPKRDGDGNVMGGVRLPDMEAPLGVHAAQQEPKSFGCSLAGAYIAFAPDRIAALYKSRDDYVQKIRTAARALQDRTAAAARGCGGDHRCRGVDFVAAGREEVAQGSRRPDLRV